MQAYSNPISYENHNETPIKIPFKPKAFQDFGNGGMIGGRFGLSRA
jgi:hypothetical protein